jgi:hypothetical protein
MPSLTRIALCATALAILVPSASLTAQAGDRAIGTWKLNLTKSKYTPGPLPKSLTLTYEVAGKGVRVTTQGVDADGKPTHTDYTANYDGKNYPVSGSADYDTVVLKKVDASTVEATRKHGGHVVQTMRRVLSKDGNVLTTTTTGTDAAGRHIKNVAVFDRQ